MDFQVLSIFPDLIETYTNESILERAQEEEHIDVDSIDIRDYSQDKHKKIDDKPYGGGAGMVMKPGPIYRALQDNNALKEQNNEKEKTILLSAKGEEFDQRKAENFSNLETLTLICGRYEGVDQRVSDYMVDDRLSIGEYVLAGGELPALVVLEATARLVRGVLGNPESLSHESYSQVGEKEQIQSSYPQYTRPREFNGWEVPEVLLSGNHKKIRQWRKDHSDQNYQD
ncbi:MAG: tRNA (guanosine(37)-N1)-methyltransferase TrmD [Candidatus Magasanikbacteria bacterium]